MYLWASPAVWGERTAWKVDAASQKEPLATPILLSVSANQTTLGTSGIEPGPRRRVLTTGLPEKSQRTHFLSGLPQKWKGVIALNLDLPDSGPRFHIYGQNNLNGFFKAFIYFYNKTS